MPKLILIIISITLIGVSYSHFQYTDSVGDCPINEGLNSKINVSELTGLWYAGRGNINPFEPDGECFDGRVELSGKQLFVHKSMMDQKTNYFVTTTDILDLIGGGLFNATQVHLGERTIVIPEINHNYAIIITCAQNHVFNGTAALIITRDRNPSEKILDEAENVLKKLNINTRKFYSYGHKNCNPNL